jgi:hypothetical protein
MFPAELRDHLRTADWGRIRLQLIAAKRITKDDTAEAVAQRYGILLTSRTDGGATALHPKFEHKGTNASAFRSTDPLEAVLRCLYMVLYADTHSSGMSC